MQAAPDKRQGFRLPDRLPIGVFQPHERSDETASWYPMVTWNCQHIANANKFGHIRRVNTLLGLFVPALVTPLELLGVDHESTNA